MYSLALLFLFVTNLQRVDDIVNRGTCDWIYTVHTDIDEESRGLLANGRLVKFRVLYERQVHGECANQTDAKNSSETASLWLKMANCSNHQARLQLFTETVLDGIFKGQFAFGAYKEVNVYYMFKLTSVGKSSSNYSSRHFTLPFLLYFVEDVANYSMPNATFLTLLSTEKNTLFSVGVTKTCGRSLSSLSSAKSANDNELIVTDGLFTVTRIIIFVLLLSLPAIFTFFRPSEMKVKVPRRTLQEVQGIRTTDEAAERERRRLHLPTIPIQTTDHNCYLKSDIREGHAPPTEHDGSREDSEIAKGTGGSSLSSTIGHGGLAILGYPGSAETGRPSDQDSKITLDATNDDSHIKYGRQFSDVRMSTDNDPLRAEGETLPTESSATNDQLFSSDGNTVDPSDANIPDDDKQTTISASPSDRNTEYPSVASSLNETRVVIDQSSEEQGEEETEYTLAITIGETYPVGFGSFIGNRLFSTSHERNIAWNIVKFIFMVTASPLLFFLGLGDLFLFLLPKLHLRLSDYFPCTFFTRSLGYGLLINHPILQVLIVFSALAHLVRVFSACFHSSNTLVAEWQSCCVHRMHPTCFAGKLAQCFISELPSFLKPCENCCKPAPSECSKYLELPQNISHNLKKLPDIFIKCWECCSDFWKKESICSLKGIFSLLGLVLMSIIFIIIGIFCMSPLVCLSHGRLQLSGCRFSESVVMFFSLVWVTIFTLLCTIPLGIAITGLIKLLLSHTAEVLPQVAILLLVLHYFWSYYKSFRKPYHSVAKILHSRYQKKLDEQQEQNSGVNALIHYKHGDSKVIPKELFVDGCEEFGLSIGSDLMWLFVKLVVNLLLCSFVFLILCSNSVLDSNTTTPIITFLGGLAYGLIYQAIDNGEEFSISEIEADKVVNDYIARKQQR